MQDKLEILLKQIKLEAEYYEYFEDAKLERVIGNKDKTAYCFMVKLNNMLPSSVYNHFIELLPNGFPTVRKVSAKFTPNNITEEMMKDYFTYFMNKYINKHPMFSVFKDIEISVNDTNIEVKVDNKIEAQHLLKIEKDMASLYNKIGVTDFKLLVGIEDINSLPIEVEIPDTIYDKKDLEPVPAEPVKRKFERKLIIENDNPSVILGRLIDSSEVVHLHDINDGKNNVVIECTLFDNPDIRETRTGLKIVTLKLTDYTDSIYAKLFVNDDEEMAVINKQIKKDNWYIIRGNVKMDNYSNELTFNCRDMNHLSKKIDERQDTAPEKRVELHTHTLMSQMDGLCDATKLVKQAKKWGHRAIAITDHNGAQSYPEVFRLVTSMNKNLKADEEPFKAIYGTELVMVDDTINIAIRPNDSKLLDNTYVVFDFETTGFNAGGGDQIIEVGAVKMCNGEILDTFDELINPHRKLPSKITEITNITDADLVSKRDEEDVIRDFIKWYGDLPMVAHNAKFDVSFLEMAYKKYNIGKYTNTVIDTLELSRTMDNNFARHSLSALVKRYNVPWDEDAHHRADYDAKGTAYVLHKMLLKLNDRNFETINDLSKLVSKNEIHKYGRTFHTNILVKNKVGLKNLFKIISLANTKYLYKTPRILRSEIEHYREGLLVGSGCYESEVFIEARSKSEEELSNIISFYDYIEIQPIDCYDHLLQTGDFASKIELINNIKKIVDVTKNAGKLIVATGDVHHINPDDKIFREIIVNQKVPGGGRHPLARSNITKIPSNHFRTTNEMLEDFSFLDSDIAYEMVITNTNKIADMIDIIEVIIQTGGVPFSPKIENSANIVNDMVYAKARSLYGDELPVLIEDRIVQELKGIIGGGFDVIYLIAQKLVKKSNDEGYLVGSRGSVGSSFVATMMGITEVNPLPAHYRCPKCKKSLFNNDSGETLGSIYSSGYDLPNKNCPDCNTMMMKDGQDMPFATFLGFNADKVPDIDLNFSDLNQADAHDYTKVLFGVDNVYRAGTIGTVASKTAFGYVKGYCSEHGIENMRTAEVERLAIGCTGVKRTTGQHPGGIVVIPGYMDVYDFTPFQYPADDPNSVWRTTHFDYHSLEEDVLKLDILGHSDPTQLRMIQDLSGEDVTKVPLDDEETMKIFLSPEPLGVTKEQIMCETGTLGIPEFGTPFTLQLLCDTKPTSFSELIKISGLSHGTDVWLGNAGDLIKNKIVPFKDVIGCRDDIMVYLMYHGVEPLKAFKIMEFVRKGKASKDVETWKQHIATMESASIPKWFINSCGKIKYMFPKAHAAAYVISAFRIAYYKVHHPVWYYSSWFSCKATDFDIEAMIKGYDTIKEKMQEISEKGYDATNKESAVLETLKLALEATARGIVFANVDLYKSDAITFKVKDDKTIYPPFATIDGLGDTVARKIVEEREKREFLSIEDLQKRAKVSGTIIEKMRLMGMLDGMEESSQLSLF